MVIVKYTSTLPDNFTGITYYSYYKEFRKNGLYNRYYGPAIYWGTISKEWRFDSKFFGSTTICYSQKQFIKDLDKKWLL